MAAGLLALAWSGTSPTNAKETAPPATTQPAAVQSGSVQPAQADPTHDLLREPRLDDESWQGVTQTFAAALTDPEKRRIARWIFAPGVAARAFDVDASPVALNTLPAEYNGMTVLSCRPVTPGGMDLVTKLAGDLRQAVEMNWTADPEAGQAVCQLLCPPVEKLQTAELVADRWVNRYVDEDEGLATALVALYDDNASSTNPLDRVHFLLLASTVNEAGLHHITRIRFGTARDALESL